MSFSSSDVWLSILRPADATQAMLAALDGRILRFGPALLADSPIG